MRFSIKSSFSELTESAQWPTTIARCRRMSSVPALADPRGEQGAMPPNADPFHKGEGRERGLAPKKDGLDPPLGSRRKVMSDVAARPDDGTLFHARGAPCTGGCRHDGPCCCCRTSEPTAGQR